MGRLAWLCPLLFLLASNGACSFYTACPSGNGNNGSGNNGGSGNGSAGNGAGGGPTDLGPIPTGTWVNATANLANMASECGNMSYLFAKPDEDLLIAGIAQKGLWSSTDGGTSWNQMGAGNGSDPITNRLSGIVFDPDDTNRFWESGLYNLGGVYETKDDGATFKQLGNVVHSDLVSVDLSDPDRQTLLAGGHEQSRSLNLSTDGGQNWTPIGDGLPDATNCTYPVVITTTTFIVGCGGYGGGPSGIYQSTDSGATWTELTALGGKVPPLLAADGSIYWAGNDALTRSTDHGATWGDELGKGVVGQYTPRDLPDGRIVTMSKDYVIISADNGVTWKAASSELPFGPVGLAYSSQQKAFFVWHQTCGFNGNVPVPPDAIMRYDFDYTTE